MRLFVALPSRRLIYFLNIILQQQFISQEIEPLPVIFQTVKKKKGQIYLFDESQCKTTISLQLMH